MNTLFFEMEQSVLCGGWRHADLTSSASILKCPVTRQLGIRHPVVFCVYVGGSLPMAISMAMAAKVPARPWPLMKMALYF